MNLTPRKAFELSLNNQGDSPMRKLILMMVVTAGLAVAACNTVEGAGKDVSSAGQAVTDTARDAK
jgi:predicted small secreted protein